MIRIATRDDIPGLARVHVQSWLETYHGLMPQEILDAITLEARILQWEWNAVLEFAQARVWESMVLWVLESNILAQGFYKHQGCVLVDRRVELVRGANLSEVAYELQLDLT
jgi:hypothetical protein